MNEQEKFLAEVTNDTFEQPLTEEPEKEVVEESAEELESKAKNRRERRLMEQNQRLREEAIAATARAQALSEVDRFRKESDNDPLKSVEAIFGTDSPEKLAATNILKDALRGMSESTKRETLEEITKQRESESAAVREEESNLETLLDNVEDNYHIDMSNADDRKGFLTLLEKLSPKDRSGNIIEYADPDSTAELYLSTRQKPNNRAKELAANSMVRGGQSQGSTLEISALERELRANDLI